MQGTGNAEVSGNVNLLANSHIVVANSSDRLTVSGVISSVSSGMGFSKNGVGDLVLRGANTFTSPSSLHEGTLTLGSGGSLADNGYVNINSGTTFDISNHSETIGVFDGSGVLSLGGSTLTTRINITHGFSGVISGNYSGFDPAFFNINATGFQNATDGGSWSVSLNGNGLYLGFTPG